MKNPTLSLLKIAVASLFITACSDTEKAAPTHDITSELTVKPEPQRLRYFREVNFKDTREILGLTGKGVRVTIMGEAVDASHPDLNKRVVKQYNTFATKNKALSGTTNQPYGFDKMGHGDGHGTHIAGTIAAECDGIGIQGIACGSTLDVYDLGTYDSAETFTLKDWGNTHELARLLTSFSTAIDDITRKGISKITTGSFNMEAPVIRYQADSQLSGSPLSNIIEKTEDLDSIDDLFGSGLVNPVNTADKDYLKQVVIKNDNDVTIALGTLLPLSKEWAELETTIQKYQKSGGVYLITESNYQFGRTSVANAMPSLSNKVDKDLWLSIVMVQPENIDNVTTEAEMNAVIKKGKYITPINICGAIAKDYCLVTPSYEIFSTMTEKVRESDAPLYKLEGRFHQSFSGHSMGAPMVAATLALMQEYNNKNNFGYSMKGLVKILKDSADRKFPNYDPIKHGRGKLDIAAALKMMRNSK